MPELPEVETVRRLLEATLSGRRLVEVAAADDPLVWSGLSPGEVEAALVGRRVSGAGRRGKLFWLSFEEEPWLYGHLGMTGWVRELGAEATSRLVSHGRAPLDGEDGQPRFLKLLLASEEGRRLAVSDGRRLARFRLGRRATEEPWVRSLGPDAWTELRSGADLAARLDERRVPVKVALMDQRLLAGVGNWVADEALYHARLAPTIPCRELAPSDFEALYAALRNVLDVAIAAGADASRYPPDWLFHHRWGGARGAQEIGGHPIVREKIGGRTAAWVPARQRRP